MDGAGTMIDHAYDHEGKVYVDVTAVFHKDGKRLNRYTVMDIEPVAFVWEDGEQYEISRVTDVCRAASRRAGGAGLRYTVNVRGKETYLFLEEDRWFMERLTGRSTA